MTVDAINVRHNLHDSEMAELAREQSRHLNKQSELEQSLIRERPAGYGITIRLDSGAIWKRRKLEESERQMVLTTELPKTYFAVAILLVDDPDWKAVEAYALPVYEDEFTKLQGLPGVLEVRAWEDLPMIEGA